jgi:hypothetical protein
VGQVENLRADWQSALSGARSYSKRPIDNRPQVFNLPHKAAREEIRRGRRTKKVL